MAIRFIDDEPKSKIRFTEPEQEKELSVMDRILLGTMRTPLVGQIQKAGLTTALGGEPEEVAQAAVDIPEQQREAMITLGEAAIPANGISGLLKAGGAIGGIESLKEKGLTPEMLVDILKGGAVGGALGVAGKGLGKVAGEIADPAREVYERLTGRRGGVLEKVTRPGTEALEIAQKGTTEAEVSPIQQMGTDLIKDLRSSFKALKKTRGEAVGEAKKEAFSRLQDTPIDSAKKYSNVVDDYISKKGEFSGKAPAIEEDLVEISNKIKSKEALTAENMQEIMDRLDEDIIAYTPKDRTRLSFGERQVVEVAKKMRNEIDNVLKNKLGDEYKDAKKLYSEVKKFETGEVLGAPSELERVVSPAVKETQAITQLKGIGAPTKGTQTAQLQELEAILQEAGYSTETLKNIDDYKAAIDFLQADTGSGSGILSFIPSLLRKAEKPVLPVVKQLRGIDAPEGIAEKLLSIPTIKHIVNPNGSTNQQNIDKIRRERGLR